MGIMQAMNCRPLPLQVCVKAPHLEMQASYFPLQGTAEPITCAVHGEPLLLQRLVPGTYPLIMPMRPVSERDSSLKLSACMSAC